MYIYIYREREREREREEDRERERVHAMTKLSPFRTLVRLGAGYLPAEKQSVYFTAPDTTLFSKVSSV